MINWLDTAPEHTLAQVPGFCELAAWHQSRSGMYKAQVKVVQNGGIEVIDAGLWPNLPSAQLAAHLKAIDLAQKAADFLFNNSSSNYMDVEALIANGVIE